MTDPKNEKTRPSATPKQEEEELISDGSASGFRETEQVNAEADKEISDEELDKLLDEK
jgi:hypothetical protein